jgi:hypothetical protein
MSGTAVEAILDFEFGADLCMLLAPERHAFSLAIAETLLGS